MNKKLLSCLLTLVILWGVLPMSALAALPEGVPGKISAPIVDNIVLTKVNSGRPIFRFEVKIPQNILDLDKTRPANGFTFIDYYCKIDNGDWEKSDGGYMDNLVCEPENKVPGKTNTFYAYAYVIDEGDLQTIDIKEHTYYYKAQLNYQYYYGKDNGEWDFIYSAFSNEVCKGSGSFYSKAADWAKPELQKASDLGLIPDILKGTDMTKPITREEFCELSVLLYEKVTGKSSEPEAKNQFKDTTNPEVLKAYKLGIVSGTSATTFSPKVLINREQCASMLFKTIKAIKPEGDFSVAGVKDFLDKKYISSWAVEATKYMSKTGIITGDSKGNFMPKATTSAQKAANYGMATREQAIALSVRTFEKMDDIKSIAQINNPEKPEGETATNVKAHPSQVRLKLPAAFPKEIPFTDDAVIQQIVDNSKANGSQSITLGYTTKSTLASITKMYKEFLKNATNLQEMEFNGVYSLTGHINYYELNIVYLDGQTHLTVTPDEDKFPAINITE